LTLKKLFAVVLCLTMLISTMGTLTFAQENGAVAKVGDVEYATIDEAISAWTNNSTLTLLADVQLSDVITLKSTEHHILNLGTYTMTAASGKNVFEVTACGTGASERGCITINADADNLGTIDAGSKSIVYYDYSKGTATGDDRPIVYVKGGHFIGSTAAFGTAGFYFKGGSKARYAMTLNISGGIFDCTINGQGKSKLIISGGIFNYSVGSQGDSTANRLIYGGRFKTFGFMTADSNNTKFWIGTKMAVSDVGVCIDDEGYIVIGGPVIEANDGRFEAYTTSYGKWSNLLQYSSAAEKGVYIETLESAMKKASSSTIIKVVADIKDADLKTTSTTILDMTDDSADFEGTIKLGGSSHKLTVITTADKAFEGRVIAADGYALTKSIDETGKIVYQNDKDENAVAVINDEFKYTSINEAINAAQDGDTIKILLDVELSAQDANAALKPVYNRESYAGLIIPDDKELTIDLNGKTISYVDEYFECDNLAIINLGNLTINDSVGSGKITYKPVAGSSTYSKFYSTIFNCGTLTINGGIIENTCDTATDVSNAVDNHSRLSHEYGNDCILVVNGGTLIGSEYRAIRQYTHYLEGVQNRVTINDGVIKGGIYQQHGDSWYYPNPADNRLNVDCYLTINGGTITSLDDGYGHVRMALSNPDNNAFGLEINGGAIEVPVQVYVQRGYRYGDDGLGGSLVSGDDSNARTAEWLEKNGGFISGGTFTELGNADDSKTNLHGFLAENFELQRTGADLYTVVAADGAEDALTADTISIEYKDITAADAEGEKVYEIVVKANGDDEIHELASVDLSFAFSTTPVVDGNMEIVVLPATDFTMTRYENSDRYMFNYNGTTAFEGTGNAISVGTITVTGYGAYTISTDDADTNIVNATTLQDNLVDFYVANGAEDADLTTGGLVINEDTVAGDGLVGKVESDVIAVPVRNLAVTIDFPNAVENKEIAYQDMKAVISGGDLAKDITIDLGSDAVETPIVIDGKVDAKYTAAMVDGSYVINVTDALTLNNAYTVTISGAGYRTARYTVTMTEDKTLRFWNNVMDEQQFVEIGKESSKVNVTFLAGDIVKDNNINIYDLSAVVSYFGSTATVANKYAKYDLNRDGVIDSKDVAYVLVSWNN